MQKHKIAIIADETVEAAKARHELQSLYGIEQHPVDADILIILGGDGFMLRVLREQLNPHCSYYGKPIYGMNLGTVGFLLNQYRADGLLERLQKAKSYILNPLKMQALDDKGKTHLAHAINEVSLFRQTHQAANVAIWVDGVQRMEKLVCDGVLLATPAGSTAYNLSAHGPILPLDSRLLALTPISPFRPRRWRGALLPAQACIRLALQQTDKRPVSAVADIVEFRNIEEVTIAQDDVLHITLLYDEEHNLEDRILNEQFIA